MKKTITILEVAKMAGVSPSTVTHTLNGKRPVGEDTKKRVMDAIDSLGYVSSWNASRLKSSSSGIIGCLAKDITETFANQIVKGIEKGIMGGRETLLFVSAVEFDNNFEAARRFLLSHDIDGLLVCHHIPNGDNQTLDDENSSVHTISINMEVPGVVSIVPDNFRGGYQAADHLYSSGMRNVAIISGPQGRSSVELRLAGFLQRIKELGLKKPNDFCFGEYTFDHGYEATKELIRKGVKFDGLFAENDYLAAGAITALTEQGIMVPEDVKVIGFDNRDFSEFWRPPITTFQQPLMEMGLLGISLLRKVIETGSLPDKKYVLEPRMVTRASTIGKNI